MKVCPIFMSPLSLNDSKSKMLFLIHFGMSGIISRDWKSHFDPLVKDNHKKSLKFVQYIGKGKSSKLDQSDFSKILKVDQNDFLELNRVSIFFLFKCIE